MIDKACFTLAPFITCFDLLHLGEALETITEAGSVELVFPIGDGSVAPIVSGLDMSQQISRMTNIPCHVLLFTAHPERHIEACAAAGCKTVTISLEASRHQHRILSVIRDAKMKAGLAVNPMTSLVSLEYLLEKSDRVCLLGVEPGTNNNTLASSLLVERVKMLHENIRYRELHTEIMVCGGVTLELAGRALAAGASIIGIDSVMMSETEEANIHAVMKKCAACRRTG